MNTTQINSPVKRGKYSYYTLEIENCVFQATLYDCNDNVIDHVYLDAILEDWLKENYEKDENYELNA